MYTYEDIILALAWYFQTGILEEDYRFKRDVEFLLEKKINCQNSCLTGTNIDKTGTSGQQSPNRDSRNLCFIKSLYMQLYNLFSRTYIIPCLKRTYPIDLVYKSTPDFWIKKVTFI